MHESRPRANLSFNMNFPTHENLSPTHAEINLGNLRHNARVLRDLSADCDLMAVVKADAYGHGAVPVTRALQEEGVRRFAVATVPEAIQLRTAGIDDDILVFAAPLPGHLPAYAAYNLEVTIASSAVAGAVIEASSSEKPLRVHAKVDTGMNRLGMTPDEAPRVLDRLREAAGIEVAGLWTHLATADEEDTSFADRQRERFDAALESMGVGDAYVHVANSDALLHLPKSPRFNAPSLVRPGIALYGMAGKQDRAEAAGLRSVMKLVSRVTNLKTIEAGESVSYGRRWTAGRTSRTPTVGGGYADGYFRLLGNRAEVGIRGRRYPVVGAVCMDMIMVDLGAPGGEGVAIETGDEVVLFGEGGPSVYEVARWAETIPYEVCCNVSARVPRIYTT